MSREQDLEVSLKSMEREMTKWKVSYECLSEENSRLERKYHSSNKKIKELYETIITLEEQLRDIEYKKSYL